MKKTWNIAGLEIEMYSTEGKIWFVNKPEDTRRLGLYAGMQSVEEAERLLKNVSFIHKIKISILSDYTDIKQVVEHNKDLEPSESGLKALEEFILSDHEEHKFDLYYIEDYIEKWIEILRNQVDNAKINFAGFQAEIVNYLDIMSILWDQDQNGQITFYKVSELSEYGTYNSGYIVAEWLL